MADLKGARACLRRAIEEQGKQRPQGLSSLLLQAHAHLEGMHAMPPDGVEALKRLRDLRAENESDKIGQNESGLHRKDWQFRRDNRMARIIATKERLVGVLLAADL